MCTYQATPTLCVEVSRKRVDFWWFIGKYVHLRRSHPGVLPWVHSLGRPPSLSSLRCGSCQRGRSLVLFSGINDAGFPRAIGSMDATHVTIEKVSYRLRQAHLGPKLHTTARSYNIVVNHRRRILSTTSGHPSRLNDKTLVRFDHFVTNIKNSHILSDLEFK
jgi:hypothetical protein